MVRETKVKNKLITFILIILGILLIVPIITSVANEFEIVHTEEEYTYIDFDATWNNDYTTIETEKHGVTGNPYSIFFTTGFNSCLIVAVGLVYLIASTSALDYMI